MPERISPGHPRRAEVLLMVAAGCALFLTGFVVFALFQGNPEADRINVKLDKQLQLLQEQVDVGIQARNANACTGYQNHRAIEQSLRDIARLNGIKAGEPRVLPSQETVRACKAVDIEIDKDGVPVLPGDH